MAMTNFNHHDIGASLTGSESVAINGSTYADSDEIVLLGQHDGMVVEITPTTANMAGFRVYVKANALSAYGDPWLEGVDFDSTSIDDLQFCTASGPHEVAAGSTAQFKIRNLLGIHAVKFSGLGSTNGTMAIKYTSR